MKAKYPDFEATLEEVMKKGYVIPFKVFMVLMHKKNGNAKEIIEKLEKMGPKGIKKLAKCEKGPGCKFRKNKDKKGKSRSKSSDSEKFSDE